VDRGTSKIIKLSDVDATGKYVPGARHRFGLSTTTRGARGACLVRVTLPPGHQSRAHFHVNAETFNYVLSVRVRVIVGAPGMETVDEVVGGDTFIYWDAGEIHESIDVSDTEPVETLGGYSVGSGEASGKFHVEPPVGQPDTV
jgi:uncharacterized RmlC-like cupin family protein